MDKAQNTNARRRVMLVVAVAVVLLTAGSCQPYAFTVSNRAREDAVTVTVTVAERPLPEGFDPSGVVSMELPPDSVRPVPGLPEDRCADAVAVVVSEGGAEATYGPPLCNDDTWPVREEPGF